MTPIASEILDRTPPHNLDAERAVIGSAILDPSRVDDLRFLRPDDFYVDAHRRIWQHVLDLGTTLDSIMLKDRLRAGGEFEAVGGAAYLIEIIHSVPVAHHAVYHGRLVAGEAKRRAIIHAGERMMQDAWGACDPSEALNRAESSLEKVNDGQYSDDALSLGESFIVALERFERARSKQGQQRHIYTGIIEIDDNFGPWAAGELIVLGARTRIGKTSFATQVAKYNARRGRLVYFASLEMDAGELAGRVLCGEAEVSRTAARSGKTTDQEHAALIEAANVNHAVPVFIDARPRMSVRDILRGARRKKKDGLGLVVADYLQIMQPPDDRAKRYEQIGQISRGLKEMARELGVPVLCLAQVGRAAEAEKDARPGLKHLREGGDIEQDADTVIFLFRENAGARENSGDGTTEYIVEKNRGGGITGMVKLAWNSTREELEDLPSARDWTP